MIQQLRNPLLRHFILDTPPFPLHNFLADHLYQEPADGYIGSFIIVPKEIFQKK